MRGGMKWRRTRYSNPRITRESWAIIFLLSILFFFFSLVILMDSLKFWSWFSQQGINNIQDTWTINHHRGSGQRFCVFERFEFLTLTHDDVSKLTHPSPICLPSCSLWSSKHPLKILSHHHYLLFLHLLLVRVITIIMIIIVRTLNLIPCHPLLSLERVKRLTVIPLSLILSLPSLIERETSSAEKSVHWEIPSFPLSQEMWW